MSTDLTAEARRIVALGEKATRSGWHTGRSDVTWFNGSGVECVAIYHDDLPDGRHLGQDLPLRLVVCEAGDTGIANPRANADFIAAARNHAPAIAKAYLELVERVEALTRLIEMQAETRGQRNGVGVRFAIQRARAVLPATPPTGTGEGNG